MSFDLDEKNREVSRYRVWTGNSMKLVDGLAVKYLPTWFESKQIVLIRTGMVWPWACGAGLVVYIAGWLLCRRLKQRCDKQAGDMVKSGLAI